MLSTARLLLLILPLITGPAFAAEPSKCAAGTVVLWGDGEHDDTAALNAWFRGAAAVWGATGDEAGAVIAGRAFRLSEAVYTPGGTGRTLEGFTLSWPERHETVTGDRLATGSDPDAPPAELNLRIVGGDSGEGVAFEAPDPPPSDRDGAAKCLVS